MGEKSDGIDNKQAFLLYLGNNAEAWKHYISLLEDDCQKPKDIGEKVIKPMVHDGFRAVNVDFYCKILKSIANISCTVRTLRHHYDNAIAEHEAEIRKANAEAKANSINELVFGGSKEMAERFAAARAVLVVPKRSVLTELVKRIANNNLIDGQTRMTSDRWFEVKDKIEYNKLENLVDIIRDHCGCQGMLSRIYSDLEKDGRHVQYKVLDKLNEIYLRRLSDGFSGESLFWKIVDDTRDAVEIGKDANDIEDTDITLGVKIIVAHAFDHCRIFKNPNDQYAAPEWNEPEI